MDRADFICNSAQYQVVIDDPKILSQASMNPIPLRGWIVIPFQGTTDHFMLDSGGWGGAALEMKVTDGDAVYFKNEHDAWVHYGRLEKIPTP